MIGPGIPDPSLTWYGKLLQLAKASDQPVEAYLRAELPLYWEDAYAEMVVRPSELVLFQYGGFDYLYDSFQQREAYDPRSNSLPIEARLVAAIGTSTPNTKARDDYRLKGFTASATPGSEGPWDKGHYIGHAIGGTVDGNEANVFRQLRSINRGRYLTMEKYCRANPGVMFFSRPLYTDTSAQPTRIEFGVLKPNGELWVESMPNR